MSNWVEKLWHWVAVVKIVVQNIFSRKTEQPPKISDSERRKYMIVMLGDEKDHQTDGSVKQPSGQLFKPVKEGGEEERVVASKTSERGVLFWCLVFLLALATMLAVLWYTWVHLAPKSGLAPVSSPMVERKRRSMGVDNTGMEMSGYGITPALSTFMAGINVSKNERQKQGARAYLRERTLPGVLVSAPLEWREKLFRLEVSTDTTSTPGDLTMGLPYQHLKIVANQGMGDCLFMCWQRILCDKGMYPSIDSLREVVADAVSTPEKLEFLSGLYSAAVEEKEDALLRDYSFMKGVESVEDLHAAIMTRAYFGDEMALDALEEKFGVRGVVLLITDNSRVSMAHRLVKKSAKPAKEFALLLLDQEGVHYELVQYMDRSVMRLDQLPPKIEKMIRDD